MQWLLAYNLVTVVTEQTPIRGGIKFREKLETCQMQHSMETNTHLFLYLEDRRL
jgi:hypothetical protein